MKFLHRYPEEQQFNEVYYNDNKYFEPWVSLTDEIERVDYNKNNGGDCLTLEILSGGTIYLGELLLEKLSDDLFTETYTDMEFAPASDLPDSSFIGQSNGVIQKSRAKSTNISFKNFYDKFKTLPPVKYKLNDNDWVDWQYDSENYYRKLDVVAGDIVKIKGDISYPSITYNNYNFDIEENIGSSIRYATFTGNIIEESVSIDITNNNVQTNADFNLNFIEIEPIDITGINIEFIQYYLLSRPEFYDDNIHSNFESYGKNGGFYHYTNFEGNKINWFISPISKSATAKQIYKKDTDNPNIKAICYSTAINYYYGYGQISGFSEIILGFLKFDNSGKLVGFTHALPTNSASYYSYNSYWQPASMLSTYYNSEINDYSSSLSFTDYTYLDETYEIITAGQQVLLFFTNKEYYVDFMEKYAFDNDTKSNLLNTSIYNFQSSNGCRFKASENLCSLYYGETYDTKKLTLYNHQYAGIFYNCEGLVSCKDLIFYPSVLSNYCYLGLFAKCTNLVEIPEFFSEDTQLAPYCYAFMFYGCTSLTYTPDLLNKNLEKGCYFGMFRGCTSLEEINTIAATEIPMGALAFMFSKCDALTAVPDLEFTYLDKSAMSCMFANCGGFTELGDFNFVVTGYGAFEGLFAKCPNLVSVGNLTFSSMSSYCCSNMFAKCPSLETVGNIVSTNGLETFCYYYMFYECTSLLNVGMISTPVLASYCCANMFHSCTAMVTPPQLPSTVTAVSCYLSMFYNCTSLLRTPELPATRTTEYNGSYYNGNGGNTQRSTRNRDITLDSGSSSIGLAQSCYEQMFMNCTSLNQIIELPAKYVGPYSYKEMFRGCTSLTTGPVIDAIWLESYCFQAMFMDCTSLVNASELKCNGMLNMKFFFNSHDIYSYIGDNYDTETNGALLGQYCFDSMFSGCTALVNAPQLKSVYVNNFCYTNMFRHCTSLTTIPEITILAAGSDSFYNTFRDCTSLINTAVIHNSIYPSGFDIDSFIEDIFDHDFFETQAWDDWYDNGCDGLDMPITSGVYVSFLYDILYERINGNSYNTNNLYANMYYGCTSLTTINKMDIVSYNNNSTFSSTFGECVSLATIPQWLWKEYEGVNYCFSSTFYRCTSLVNVPTINIDYLAPNFFNYTFSNCTSLITAPNIEATYFAGSCCYYMFDSCTSLITPPMVLNVLSIETNNKYFFQWMFYGCTSLIKSPKIIISNNISTSSDGLFTRMFENCTSLSEIYFDFINNTNTYISAYWVSNVGATGIFKTRYGKSYPFGVDNIPVGWTVEYIDDFGVTLNKNELLKKDSLTVTGWTKNALTITTNPSLQNNTWLAVSQTTIPAGNFEFTVTTNITNEELNDTVPLIIYFNNLNIPIASENVLIYANSVKSVKNVTTGGNWATNGQTLDGKTIYTTTSYTSSGKYRWISRITISGCQKIVLRVADTHTSGSYPPYLVISKPDQDFTSDSNISSSYYSNKIFWTSNGKNTSQWYTVTITFDNLQEHFILVAYSRDDSSSSSYANGNNWSGYFYIKNIE